tara:strand:+ start:613 stop:993 length:381 start_codon:yes stop_codon:yes gene_type:complete
MAFTKRKARRKMDFYINSYIGQDRLFKMQINDTSVLVVEMTPITTRQFALRASLQKKISGEKRYRNISKREDFGSVTLSQLPTDLDTLYEVLAASLVAKAKNTSDVGTIANFFQREKNFQLKLICA